MAERPSRRAQWIVVLALLLPTAAAADEVYTVAVNNAPPYRIIEKTETGVRYSGFYIDFIKELAKRTGIRIGFKEVPFKRALVLMERGDADFMLGPNRRPEREVYMVYLDAELTRESKVFYVKKDAPDIAGYDDLADRRIAVLRGSTYFDRFDDDGTLEKIEVADYLTALRMVERGRVGTVIMPELLGDYLIAENGFDLEKGSLVVEGRPSFITISRKSPLLERRQEIEAALSDIKQDGTVARIVDRYKK